MSRLTKAEAVAVFRDLARDIPRDDVPMWSEAWNCYTDALCKDRQITQHQYSTWQTPSRGGRGPR